MLFSGHREFVALAMVVAMTATACGDEQGSVTSAVPLATRVFDDSSGIDDSQTEGELVLSGGCLSLVSDGVVLTVVWPDGFTEWDGDLQQVTMNRNFGQTFVATVGDFVLLGGSEANSTQGFDWAMKPDDECSDLFWVTG